MAQPDEHNNNGRNYLNAHRGFLSWLFTLDHKRIAVMYLIVIAGSYLLGGVFALLMRTELMVAKQSPKYEQIYRATTVVEETPEEAAGAEGESRADGPAGKQPAGEADVPEQADLGGEDAGAAPDTDVLPPGWEERPEFSSGFIMNADTYNRIFTLHGAIMVFLFIIPGIPAIFGNFVLPIMLGARDVAFPRLNLFSFHLWVIGGVFFVITLVSGIDTGWTFYAPYSTHVEETATGIIAALIGAFILGFSSIFTGINFLVTIHKMRPEGMTWFRMPLMLWALYATAIVQVLATPVLGITLLLLLVERIFAAGIFDPNLGGDPILMQHFFWFYSHPAVYIMILPAFGIVSELIAVHARKHIFGYRFIAYSSLAIALLGFLVWGHHMFTSGQSTLAGMIFSALTFSIAIPSAIKVFNWLATMYKGDIHLRTPMMYALAFLLVFGIGGLTGIFLGALATDVHLHDTYFVVAHFHYVMMGSVVMAFLGALHHWWPKMFGRMYNEPLGEFAAILMFFGINGTFLPQFVLGTLGNPRRYFNYEEGLESLHRWSSAGAFLTAIAVILIAWNLLHSLFKGKAAPANPWGGASLEWQTSSPPPEHNFGTQPPAPGSPYDMKSVVWDDDLGGYRKRTEAEEAEDAATREARQREAPEEDSGEGNA
jgi:cytochrome c oxidase subunit 1